MCVCGILNISNEAIQLFIYVRTKDDFVLKKGAHGPTKKNEEKPTTTTKYRKYGCLGLKYRETAFEMSMLRSL